MPVTVCLSERPVNLSGIAPAHAPLDLVTRHSEGAHQLKTVRQRELHRRYRSAIWTDGMIVSLHISVLYRTRARYHFNTPERDAIFENGKALGPRRLRLIVQ